MTTQTVLVLGSTGVQGRPVALAALAAGHRVRALIRTPAKADLPGAELIAGDLDADGPVHRAFEGATAASVHFPLDYDRPRNRARLDRVLAAAARAGLRKLVLNTSGPVPLAATGKAALDLNLERVERTLACGVPATVLRPQFYLDNLVAPWCAAPLRDAGLLVAPPLPAHVECGWISSDDLARLTLAALAPGRADGELLDAAGVRISSAALAERLARALGRPVAFAGPTIDQFEAGLAQAFGPEVARAVADIYRWVEAGPAAAPPMPAAGDAFERLGLRPGALDAWLASRPELAPR